MLLTFLLYIAIALVIVLFSIVFYLQRKLILLVNGIKQQQDNEPLHQQAKLHWQEWHKFLPDGENKL